LYFYVCSIEDIIKDKWITDESAFRVFEHPKELDEFRKVKLNTSLFVLKLGQVPIWMPNKFKNTKNSEVADTIDEVAR